MTIIYIYSKLRIYINPFVGLLTSCQNNPYTSFKNSCGISRFTTNSTHLLHIFNQLIIICMIAYDMFHITDIKCSPQEKTF